MYYSDSTTKDFIGDNNVTKEQYVPTIVLFISNM